jgi:lipopolysaccharide transport system ATP-binding protein
MTRKEVRFKFDEIVNFAEISEFIDTPVKRYSSGMYVRLAFAVAAHLEPEILIVDEVLAVGDAEFQKKCLGKMRSVSRQGRTILFVSHNMSAIESLCESAIWFDSGRIQGVSTDVSSIVSTYLNTKSDINSKSVWVKPADRRYSKHFEPIAMKVVGKSDKKNEARFNKNDEIFIEIAAHIEAPDPALQVGIQLLNSEGSVVYWTFNTDSYSSEDHCTKCSGTMKWRVEIPKGILNVGDYFVEMLAALYFREWLLEPGRDNPSVNFSITGKFSDSPYWMNKRPGILAPVLNWVTNEEG